MLARPVPSGRPEIAGHCWRRSGWEFVCESCLHRARRLDRVAGQPCPTDGGPFAHIVANRGEHIVHIAVYGGEPVAFCTGRGAWSSTRRGGFSTRCSHIRTARGKETIRRIACGQYPDQREDGKGENKRRFEGSWPLPALKARGLPAAPAPVPSSRPSGEKPVLRLIRIAASFTSPAARPWRRYLGKAGP